MELSQNSQLCVLIPSIASTSKRSIQACRARVPTSRSQTPGTCRFASLVKRPQLVSLVGPESPTTPAEGPGHSISFRSIKPSICNIKNAFPPSSYTSKRLVITGKSYIAEAPIRVGKTPRKRCKENKQLLSVPFVKPIDPMRITVRISRKPSPGLRSPSPFI